MQPITIQEWNPSQKRKSWLGPRLALLPWSAMLLMSLPGGNVLAFKPKQPERHDLQSRNRRFVTDVDPKAKRFTVYTVGDRQHPLWSFEREVGLGEHFLADDGKTMAVVRWKYVSGVQLVNGICLEFWNTNGRIKTYTFDEICPNPAITIEGPVGDDGRKWYLQAGIDGDDLCITTTEANEYTFSLADGVIQQKKRVIEVLPQPELPQPEPPPAQDVPLLWTVSMVLAAAAGLIMIALLLVRRRLFLARNSTETR